MVYAGILAHGTALSAAETARMIPQVSAPAVRQAMRWAADERRTIENRKAVYGAKASLPQSKRLPPLPLWHMGIDDNAARVGLRHRQLKVRAPAENPHAATERRRVHEQIEFLEKSVLDQRRDEAGAAIDNDVLAVLALQGVDCFDQRPVSTRRFLPSA